ncbi:AraC family transcriptional regulator [soil metagenome]
MRYLLHFMRDLPEPPNTQALPPDAVDPLSDLLALLRARCLLTASLETAGDWAMRFAAYEPGTLKFSALVRGRCWLRVEPGSGGSGDKAMAPIELHAGDCVLLNGPPGYVLASDLALPPVDAGPVFAAAPDRRARYGQSVSESESGSGPSRYATQLIGGSVRFDESCAGLLLDSLPPVVVVQRGSDAATVVQWLLQQLAHEMQRPQVGTASVTTHLAHLLFVQVLRAHLASNGSDGIGAGGPGGWLGAAAHPRIGTALGLMHGQPARRWTLDALADAARMSRSSFSERFKAMVGRAPMDYLLHWRMQLALRALRERGDAVSTVAFDAGYESESAFSNAFKRVMGQSPAHYRREWRARAAT